MWKDVKSKTEMLTFKKILNVVSGISDEQLTALHAPINVRKYSKNLRLKSVKALYFTVREARQVVWLVVKPLSRKQ